MGYTPKQTTSQLRLKPARSDSESARNALIYTFKRNPLSSRTSIHKSCCFANGSRKESCCKNRAP